MTFDPALFMRRREEAGQVEALVAYWLADCASIPARALPHPPIHESVAKNAAEGATQVDVLVGERLPLEVKARGLPFTSPTDYPYEDACVNACRSWDKKRSKPWATVLVSTVTWGAVVVPTSSRKRWRKRVAHDSKYDEDIWFYWCPVEHLRTWTEMCVALRATLGLEEPAA